MSSQRLSRLNRLLRTAAGLALLGNLVAIVLLRVRGQKGTSRRQRTDHAFVLVWKVLVGSAGEISRQASYLSDSLYTLPRGCLVTNAVVPGLSATALGVSASVLPHLQSLAVLQGRLMGGDAADGHVERLDDVDERFTVLEDGQDELVG